MLKICTVKYVYKTSVSTDDDLDGALEDSNTETMLRKFFEGTSLRNERQKITVICVTVTFCHFFPMW